MEHAFGSRPPFRLGIEEELLLVEPDTLALVHVASELIPRVAGVPAEVKHDVYEALVETSSPVVPRAADAVAALEATRDALRAAGATLVGCGIHPAAPFADVIHVPTERYAAIAEEMRGLVKRTPTCALHVHVGMPDPETAIAACNRLRAWLPVLQALAAHSPYWHGLDSGFQTARAQLFRGFPRAAIPRTFAGWEDYVAVVDAWTAAGELEDYTFLWWDVRPHPRLGTVEVRAMDAQAHLGAVAGLGALVHGLAVACATGAWDGAVAPAEALQESSFRAGRDGLAARLWWEDGLRPVHELAREAIAVARTGGAGDELQEVERLLRDGTGADAMRRAHRRGGMRAVLEWLRDATASPAAAPAARAAG